MNELIEAVDGKEESVQPSAKWTVAAANIFLFSIFKKFFFYFSCFRLRGQTEETEQQRPIGKQWRVTCSIVGFSMAASGVHISTVSFWPSRRFCYWSDGGQRASRRPGGPLKNGAEGPNGSSAMESVRQNIPSSDGAEDTLDVSHRLNLRPAATSSPALRRRRHYLWRSHRRVEQSSFYAIMDQAGKSMAASSSTVPSCPRHFLCSSKHNSLFKAPAALETHETVEPQLNYQ